MLSLNTFKCRLLIATFAELWHYTEQQPTTSTTIESITGRIEHLNLIRNGSLNKFLIPHRHIHRDSDDRVSSSGTTAPGPRAVDRCARSVAVLALIRRQSSPVLLLILRPRFLAVLWHCSRGHCCCWCCYWKWGHIDIRLGPLMQKNCNCFPRPPVGHVCRLLCNQRQREQQQMDYYIEAVAARGQHLNGKGRDRARVER